jgi:hypothetical protein
MRNLIPLALALFVLTGSSEHASATPSLPPPAVGSDPHPLLPSDEPPASLPASLTPEDVLSMMARAPATEFGTKAYPKWAKTGAANRIAKAIADHAETREEAGDMVVYVLYESGNVLSAVGDSGKSHGPWQLNEKRAAPSVARDPDQAAPVWLSLARASRKDCEKLPEDDRLAELASGSCAYGRTLARRRARLRDRILSE